MDLLHAAAAAAAPAMPAAAAAAAAPVASHAAGMVPCVEVIANALGPREASPKLFHSLSMLHNNTRAAVSHRAMLVVQSRLLNISPAFVCFNNTFLNQNISNTAAAFGGFNPPTPPKLKRVRPQTKHRSQPATFLKQHVKQPPELTEHKPVTSTKTKPAASIEQSSNRSIESKRQIEPSKLQIFSMEPPWRCRRYKLANPLVSQLLNIIKM